MDDLLLFFRKRIKFDRNELSGAFGDIGTSIPLLIAVIAASGLDGGRVFIMFGLMQIATAITYGIPMSVQPLKAVAMLVIAQKISGPVIWGAGLSIGIIMFLLTLTGALDKIGKLLPETVIRGVQFGLGIQLAITALKEYIPSGGIPGYVLACACGIIGFVLLGNRKYPPAFLLIIMGIIYALLAGRNGHSAVNHSVMETFCMIPKTGDIFKGFILLAIPQIPLSLGNSIYATEKVGNECFPGQTLTKRRIGFTYSLMNLINPIFGGFPVCHGSGGLAGHYAFGARTGGSVFIYGLIMLSAGVFLGNRVTGMASLFPKAVLGSILFFEAISLMSLVRKHTVESNSFIVVLFTGFIAAVVPYGYVAAMICGTLLHNYYFKYGTRKLTASPGGTTVK